MNRRFAAVRVSQELIAQMMIEGYCSGGIQCLAGVPEGAIYRRAYMLNDRGDVYFVFYHDSFDSVAEGHSIPLIDVTMQRLYD